ncbi:MAG: DUF948 domain-containing protein [Calditrichaceae bacterium]|nr:DUF948 domain-containing protein [Calditrichia bacterium]NUQ40000.1 DUF948 domain-containing protein [Calditrichaceae bacterium]
MIWEISTLIASIALLILVAFLIPAILQVRRTIKKMEDLSEKLDRDLPDILVNVREISANLSAILQTGRYQAESLGEALDQVRGAMGDIVGFQRRVKREIESPLLRTVDFISAASRAVQTFLVVFLSHKRAKRKH